jgi:hypothetical protein
VPEKYGDLELEVPQPTDEASGADVPASFRRYTDSLDQRFTAPAGHLLIAQPSDVARFVEMSGDGEIDKDGVFTIGSKVARDDQGKLAERPKAGRPGYYFYATDADIVFRDNGSSWDVVNTKITSGLVQATSTLVLTTNYSDIPGTLVELTPAVNSKLLVQAIVTFQTGGGAGWEGIADLKVGALLQEGRMYAKGFAENEVLQRFYVYEVPLSAATKYPVKLQAKRSSGTGGSINEGVGGTRYAWQLTTS